MPQKKAALELTKAAFLIDEYVSWLVTYRFLIVLLLKMRSVVVRWCGRYKV